MSDEVEELIQDMSDMHGDFCSSKEEDRYAFYANWLINKGYSKQRPPASEPCIQCGGKGYFI